MKDEAEPSLEPEDPDPGGEHLVWIFRFQIGLMATGALFWLLRSWVAALVFLAGSCGSLAFWSLHRFQVARMLNEKVRLRWVYGSLVFLKLALIVLILRGMMGRYPAEVLPLVMGLLLFVLAILFEALRLMGLSFFHPSDDEPR